MNPTSHATATTSTAIPHSSAPSTATSDLIHRGRNVLTVKASGFQCAPLDQAIMTAVQEHLFLEDKDHPAVTELVFQQCELVDPQALQILLEIFTASSPQQVQTLRLNGCTFESQCDFSRLLQALQTNTSITNLDFSTSLSSCNYLAADGALQAFLSENMTVTKLNLTGHTLKNPDVARELAHGLRQNSTLQELHLHSCSLEDETARLILEGEGQTSSLRLLDLGSNNELSSHFFNTTLTNFLTDTTKLQSLVLDHNSNLFAAGSRGMAHFLSALRSSHCSSLNTLSLRFCTLTQETGEALVQMLESNTTLQHLNLEFTGFGLKGQSQDVLMRTLPKWKYLQTLKIHMVVPEETSDQFLAAIGQNTSLKEFHHPLFRGPSSAQHKATLQHVLARNRAFRCARELTNQSFPLPVALLPIVAAKLSTMEEGPAATHRVLSHCWVEHICLSSRNHWKQV